MVERLLSKPEVRGAIPRISEVKDIEQLINFLQKTTEYWSLIQEAPSKKISPPVRRLKQKILRQF